MRAFSQTFSFLPSNRRRILAAILLAGLALLSGPSLSAQGPQTARPQLPPPVAVNEADAEQVRQEFMAVLEKYPPALGQLLKLDPSLMATDQYLVPYPGVAEFLVRHPEVRRSPSFYLKSVRTVGYESYYRSDATRVWENMFDAIGVFAIIVTILSALGWVIRTLINYRRWGRLAKVQAEAHTKLLDRFTANDELLAYVQSPAGSRFLQSAPISLDSGARTLGAPLSRILWALQAGVVLATLGVGFSYLSGHVDPDIAQPIYGVSVIAFSLGVGFILSAALSFLMSKRMGLLAPPVDTREGANG